MEFERIYLTEEEVSNLRKERAWNLLIALGEIGARIGDGMLRLRAVDGIRRINPKFIGFREIDGIIYQCFRQECNDIYLPVPELKTVQHYYNQFL